jgi:CHAT domain-containing protein
LGQTTEALADVREDLSRIEILRTHLAPSDFYKRDYSDWQSEIFSFAIDLLSRSGKFGEALETSERARARGFVDLLASHQVALGHAEQEKLQTLQKTKEEIKSANAAPQVSASEASTLLATRGAKSAPAAEGTTRLASEPELPSMVSAGSASLEEMKEQARRLHSTILSYWVEDESTVVWIIDSQEVVHSARIPVKREYLAELVQAVWPRGNHSASSHGAPSVEAASQQPKPPRAEEVNFPARGEAELKAEPAQKDHWRELYQLLIQPLEAYLPANHSRITIIPHGPLFSLPFAGLRDSHDRYFLERYTLEYAPAISALRFTGASGVQSKVGSPSYLFVADPSDMQKLGLPQLPGSEKEVSSITAHLPADEVTVLVGPQAKEQTIRTNAAKSTVIHFATHGMVNDAQPFDSFLALSDGKLTARDIYGLNLNADLVFLSACRSGMGKVTGDGVLGLTRAFLYAGTRSVVATLWDVADEPTARLVEKFYSNLRQGQDKAQALRSAQLFVLSQLRAGRLHVATRRGPLTLPENPVFWASFVLIGEP